MGYWHITMYSKIQYISQGRTEADQLRHIRSALDAGVTWIQLRFKDGTAADVYALAEKVRLYCHEYKATFIVNDWLHVAHATDADGVHLGLADSPVEQARVLLGRGKLIGGTANTLAEVRQRIAEACDYIGLGPYRFTSTKEKLSPVLGISGYRKIVASVSSDIIPIYAIGGITAEDVEDLKATGVYGICISGAITNAADRLQLVKTLYESMYG